MKPKERRWQVIALLAAGMAVGVTMTATPAVGHVSGWLHNWKTHIKPRTDARYYTKRAANKRYVNVNEAARNLSCSGCVSPGEHGQVPAVRVTQTETGIQAIDNGFNQALEFDSERYDTHAMHDNASNNTRLVAPIDGLYSVHANIIWPVNDVGGRFLGIVSSRMGPSATASAAEGVGFEHDQSVSTIVPMKAGDYVEIVVSQTSGTALTLEKVESASPEASMTWIGRLPNVAFPASPRRVSRSSVGFD